MTSIPTETFIATFRNRARAAIYAQEELDAENAEAERYPLGAKEFWRSRLVGKATYGADAHPMTNEECESDWDQSQQRWFFGAGTSSRYV